MFNKIFENETNTTVEIDGVEVSKETLDNLSHNKGKEE